MGRRPRRPQGGDDAGREDGELVDKLVSINRVAKVVKGGRRFSFTALVVIGDGAGRVGLGYGKAKEAGLAVQKGIEEARKNLFDVPLAGTTIVYPVLGASGAGRGTKAERLFCEVNEGLRAYGMPRHRHAWGVEERASA